MDKSSFSDGLAATMSSAISSTIAAVLPTAFSFSRNAFQPRSLRVFSKLLSYPDQQLRTHLDAIREALHADAFFSAQRLLELDALLKNLARTDALLTESDYVELFDRGRATSLHLFEHVHGDSRDRGPAMIDLIGTYEKAGLYLGVNAQENARVNAEGKVERKVERKVEVSVPGTVDVNELPDYLPVVLEFVSTQPVSEARAFLGEISHILNAIFNALQQRSSPYASIFGALLEMAGEKASPVTITTDAALDDTWEEPAVFAACSTKGQDRPDQPKPIKIVKRGVL